MSSDLSDQLTSYLRSWFATSTKAQAAQGVDVRLTFDEFVGLFQRRQLTSLERAIEINRLRYQQDQNNQFAYILTWRSYAARSTNVFDKDTAIVCSRMKSSKINLPAAGDRLRPDHVENIRKGLIGKPKAQDHRDSISAAKKGVKITTWSDERKAKRRADLAAKRDPKSV